MREYLYTCWRQPNPRGNYLLHSSLRTLSPFLKVKIWVQILTLSPFCCVTLGSHYVSLSLCSSVNGSRNRSYLSVIMCIKLFTYLECGYLTRKSTFLSHCLQRGQRIWKWGGNKPQSPLEDKVEGLLRAITSIWSY